MVAGYQSHATLGLALLRRAQATGALVGRWVTADEAFGLIPTFRDALDAEGYWYVVEVPCTTPVFTAPPHTHTRTHAHTHTRTHAHTHTRSRGAWPRPPPHVRSRSSRRRSRCRQAPPRCRPTSGRRSPSPRARRGHRRTNSRLRGPARMGEPGGGARARRLAGPAPQPGWPRTPGFPLQCPRRHAPPDAGAGGRHPLDGGNQVPDHQRPRRPGRVRGAQLARVAPPRHAVSARQRLSPLPPAGLGGSGGKKEDAAAPNSATATAPRLSVTRPQVARVLRERLPQRRWTHADLRHWLAETRCHNARATASHAKRRRLQVHQLSL